ncbi:MAG: hypothetical protein K2N34_10705 [Lachnospiraceae bacterium]|nr:hypothetical protein [Lachnospiraceae bacterium]
MSRKELMMKNIVIAFSYLYSDFEIALDSIHQGLDFVHSYKIERKRKLCINQINAIKYQT